MFECDDSIIIYCQIHVSILPGSGSLDNNRLYVTFVNKLLNKLIFHECSLRKCQLGIC